MTGAPDVIAWAETELAAARTVAARAYDRADALAELRSLFYGMAAELNSRTLTPEQLRHCTRDAEAGARLDALIDRTTTTEGTG